MEPVMWWLWLLARLIIFLVTVRLSVWLFLWVVEKVYGVSVSVRGYKLLVADEVIVKSKDYELVIEKPRLQLRWLNRSCRRFFRVRLYNVQLQYARIPPPPPSSNHSNKVVGGATKIKPSKKRRLLNHVLRQASRLVEVTIDQVDLMMQDVISDTLSFLDMLRVTGGISVLARPMPESMMAVSFEVDRMSCQSCACVSSSPQLPTNDDVVSLLESVASCRGLLFLAPLSLQRPLDSVQLNFSSFSLQLQSEPLTYFVQRINQLLTNRKLSQAQSPSSSLSTSSKVTTRLPPQRSEVTFDKAYIEYCTEDRHRVLTGEVSSLSLSLQVTSTSSELAAIYSMAMTAKDLLLKPRLSPDIARIKHLRLVTKFAHPSLESSLSLCTGKASVRESDIVYWSRHFTQLHSSLRRPSHMAPSPSLLHRIMTVPVTMVTTIEASDWLCSMQLDRSTVDQRPQVELVMASMVLRGQLEEKKEMKRSVSIQARLDDTYLHVPGGKSWSDNRTLLPSSFQHHWGRGVAVGSLALNTAITLSSAEQPSITGVCVSGEGRSVIVEWSQYTATTLMKALTQLDTRYQVLSRWLPTTRQTHKELEETDPYSELLVEPGTQSSTDLVIGDTSIHVTIVLNGVNAFLYGASPVPVAMLLRVDTISLTTPGLVSAVLYRAAINELTYQLLPHEGFLCQPVASLPSGLLDITDMQLEYSLVSKEVNVSVTKGTINWTTPTHIAITHIVEALWATMKGTKPAVNKTASLPGNKEEEGFVKIGDKLVSVMDKVPVVIGVKVEEGVVNMILDQSGSKVAVVVETGHGYLKDGMLLMDSYQLGLVFDTHRIVNLFGFIGNYPSEEGEGEGGRDSVTGLQLKKNPTLALCASKAFIKFPSQYNFAATFEKLMCVRKYIQGFHSSRGTSPAANQRLVILPDLLVEVDELLFQLDDNAFEVKLRENHVLMQDEQEERVQRQKALEERLMRTKEEKGRSRVSDKKVQTLYDKLRIQNDSIYCQRARELYNIDEEIPRQQLFTVSLHQLKVLVMADPTMTGRDNLVKHLTDIDSVSPLPSSNYQFSTLWGIYLSGGTEHVEVQLRDYPWKLLEGESIGVSGRLLFAEQEAQQREQYITSVRVGAPWKDGSVVKKLPPLKYYHDLEINAECIEWCWGPCCEPCFAQINYTFNFITKPALDPSPPLPFWDKFRLLLHGRAHLNTSVMVAKLLASRDPYNEPEYLEIRLTTLDARLHDNVNLDLVGGAHAFVHTASRYDECQLVQLPLAHLSVSLEWVCRSAPQCHHEVIRCVPSKLPQLPEGQQHDSYALFRSHNMNITMDLRVEEREDLEDPEIHLYASTLRWLQQYVSLLRETVSRPIRRGRVFKNVRPKKLKLTRHIKTFSLSASFPKTTLQYWSSVYQQRGVECHVSSGTCDMKYTLQLIPYDDGLVRRPKTDWSVASLQGEVMDILTYTCTKQEEVDLDSFDDQYIIRNPYAEEMKGSHNVIVKHKLVSMSKLTYWQNIPTEETSQEFTHQLKTSNTRILWNSSNKEVVDRLLNAYRLFQRLKKDLSTEALQSIITKLDTPTHKSQVTGQGDGETVSTKRGHMRRLSSSGCAMLDSLLADICNTLVVSSVEQKEPSDPRLKGIVTANQDDMKQLNWFIELTNTQLALQGVEKHGYVVASSYIAQVFGREHSPRWREGDLVSKKSWVAKVQDLQFLCTTELSADERDKVPWLPLSVIQPAGLKEEQQPDSLQDEESSVSSLLSQLGPEISHPLGVKASFVSSRPPGEAVGGMVASVPEPGTIVEDPGDMPHTPHTPLLSSPHRTGYQLQRIASRGHCQVFYVTYGGDVSSSEYPSSDLLNQSGNGSPLGFSESSDVVDTLTFRFPMAEVCTTSNQYHLIVDVLNNLLLHKEPRKKEATEQHARMKFLLQLSTVADARKPVLAKQNKIRHIIRKVHELETELYREQKQGGDGLQRRSSLERELSRTKEDLSVFSVELRAMIRAFKEQQLNMTTPRSDSGESLPPEPVRRVEVWLDDSQWNIMQDDGQLQVSEIQLTNFSYNRISFSDDSGEHRFELGSFKVLNCMPNTQTFFQEVLSPYDPQSRRLRVDKNVSMRIYCRDQAPVAGISVTEHLELNIVPLAVRLTEKFYQTMQDFFLPRQEGETRESTSDPDHSYIFGGVKPTFASSPDSTDGAAISRSTHHGRSNSSLTFSTHSSSAPPSTIGTQPSPPDSPISKDFVRSKSRRTSGTVGRIDDVEKMKVRASKVKAFIYVKIPQLTLCLTYKGEGISVKEMHDQLVTVHTLEYHNKKCTWRELLMEVKKDYKNAIISQTIKSAIGIRESDEKAGLASPKLHRHTSTSDILMGGIKVGKATSKKLLTRLSSSKEEDDDDGGRKGTSATAVYQPPLADVNTRKRPKLFSKQ